MEDSDPGQTSRTMSSMASSTDVSVESEGGSGAGGWFGLGDVTSSIARSLKRTIPPAIDGIADVIQRSAMNVAAEFAEMEREAEREAHQWRVEQGLEGEEEDTPGNADVLPLPWELRPTGCPSYAEDGGLKKKILALSLDEATFKGPHGTGSEPAGNSISSINSEDSDFSLDDSRVYLIKRLLDLDTNLAHIHARLSGRSEVKETIFWKNYFHHCDQLRDDHAVRDEEVDAELVESPSLPPHPSSPSTPKRAKNVVIPKTPTSPPKVLSMEDLVLVGGEDDDLNHLAADISRESKD